MIDTFVSERMFVAVACCCCLTCFCFSWALEVSVLNVHDKSSSCPVMTSSVMKMMCGIWHLRPVASHFATKRWCQGRWKWRQQSLAPCSGHHRLCCCPEVAAAGTFRNNVVPHDIAAKRVVGGSLGRWLCLLCWALLGFVEGDRGWKLWEEEHVEAEDFS